MPLPFLLIGAAVVTGLVGVKNVVQATVNSSDANNLNNVAQAIFDNAKHKMIRQKLITKKDLENFGEIKLYIWDKQIKMFVETFGKILNVELTEEIACESSLPEMSREELREMQEISMHASEVLRGGMAALGTGALAGFGASGGASMFAAASTGTAISSLSGVAATNATLAWFGGGSLAAGGLGMAGGAAVLGGIVTGPALMVGGFLLSAKAKEKLAVARSNYAKAKESAAQMNKVTATLKGITTISKEFSNFITPLALHVNVILKALKELVTNAGPDYRKYNEKQRQLVHLAVEYVSLLKAVLETPLLTKDGSLKSSLGKNLAGFKSAQLQLEAA